MTAAARGACRSGSARTVKYKLYVMHGWPLVDFTLRRETPEGGAA